MWQVMEVEATVIGTIPGWLSGMLIMNGGELNLQLNLRFSDEYVQTQPLLIMPSTLRLLISADWHHH